MKIFWEKPNMNFAGLLLCTGKLSAFSESFNLCKSARAYLKNRKELCFFPILFNWALLIFELLKWAQWYRSKDTIRLIFPYYKLAVEQVILQHLLRNIITWQIYSLSGKKQEQILQNISLALLKGDNKILAEVFHCSPTETTMSFSRLCLFRMGHHHLICKRNAEELGCRTLSPGSPEPLASQQKQAISIMLSPVLSKATPKRIDKCFISALIEAMN